MSGISSGVSRQAKPIIMPWSPAPCSSNGICVARTPTLLERVVDARGDVRRLLLEIDLDQRVVGVEADLLVVVADRADGVADRALDVELGVGRDLADDDAESLGDGGLARNTRMRVLCEHSVQHGVGDLVADLVGMPLGD